MNPAVHPAAEAVKRILRQPRRAALALEEKRGRISALESLIDGVRAMIRPGDARESSILITLVELRSSLLDDVQRYSALVREVERLLARCLPDERHRAVMEAHYLGFSTWEAVADQVGYTPRHVMRLHRESLHLIAEHMYALNTPQLKEASL